MSDYKRLQRYLIKNGPSRMCDLMKGLHWGESRIKTALQVSRRTPDSKCRVIVCYAVGWFGWYYEFTNESAKVVLYHSGSRRFIETRVDTLAVTGICGIRLTPELSPIGEQIRRDVQKLDSFRVA